MQIFQVLNELLEACEQHKITMLGQPPHEEFKYSCVLYAELVVALQHRELIQVCEECANGPVR